MKSTCDCCCSFDECTVEISSVGPPCACSAAQPSGFTVTTDGLRIEVDTPDGELGDKLNLAVNHAIRKALE